MVTITRNELMSKLGAFVRVENAPSRNGYGHAPNQFILTFENGQVFQSYATLVGARIDWRYYFMPQHDCSNTTSGHVGRWCGMNTKERRKAIEDGTAFYVTD